MTRCRLTLVACVCALSGALAHAQAHSTASASGTPTGEQAAAHALPPDGGRAPTSSEVDAAVRAHDRARIHPGDPLALVGVEQQGNDARARTPVLANSVRRTESVDADENYRRTLAMYEQGARFHTPLAPADPRAAHAADASNAARPSAARTAPASASSSILPWIGAALLACAVAGWTVLRFKPPHPAARR